MDSPAVDGSAWTVARLLNWTRDFLQRQNVESSRLCAEILLAHALGCQRIELYTRYESVPDETRRTRFRELVKEAGGGAPIAYLVGTKDFFSLSFIVTRDVLIPRPETELLVERTIDLSRRQPGRVRRVLDLCCGSGCIAVALARHLPDARLHASDISSGALNVARQNAARHGLSERIDIREGDLFGPWRDEPAFDVIVTNPPYIAAGEMPSLPRNVRDFEPHLALAGGDDGLAIVRRIAVDAPPCLAEGGWLMTEVAFNQAQAVSRILNGSASESFGARGSWREVTSYRDDLGHERVVAARRA
ncbi:MAG: peptide chain release factor N(5)-glutamine methyltransferase [Phycisphaerae bacterium]